MTTNCFGDEPEIFTEERGKRYAFSSPDLYTLSKISYEEGIGPWLNLVWNMHNIGQTLIVQKEFHHETK
jgi:hypothetical protein